MMIMLAYSFLRWPQTWLGYWLILAFAVTSSIGAMGWVASHNNVTVNLGDYFHYRCDTQASVSEQTMTKPRFRFLTISSLYADKIAQQLCQSDLIGQYYSGVTISWKPRWLLSPTDILNENYDLIWSRENALHGLVPNFSDYYNLLVEFDNYQVSWFSKGATPQMTQAYFSDKRVGILRDTLSQTHHLLPLVSLKKANIQLDDAQLIQFDDASSLYQAFVNGSVDLMTGGEWLRREVDAPLNALFISDKVRAAALYLRKVHYPAVECELINAVSVYQQKLSTTHMQIGLGNTCYAE